MRVTLACVALLALAVPVSARLDPGSPGRFPVGVTTLTVVDTSRDRTLVTEVWYPAARAGRDAALRHGRFPLTLVAHGSCGFRTNYEYLTTHLASWGFVVAAPDFPGFNKTICGAGQPPTGLVLEPPLDLAFLRAAFHDRAGAAARFVHAVRGQRAGLAGHSLGGLAVLNGAIADAHFTAVVGLAPAAAVGTGQMFVGLRPPRAVLVLGGTADDLVHFDSLLVPLFDALPSPAFLVKKVDGTHSGFTDMDHRLTPDALARQQAITRRYATALLERYLAGRRRFARFLTARDAEGQGTDVMLTARPR